MEITLFILLLVVGFATVQLYRIGPRLENERREMEDLHKKFEEAKKTFEEAQTSVVKQDPSRNFFKIVDASKIQDEYRLLAENLESQAENLHQAFIEFADQKIASEPGDAKLEELKKALRDWRIFLNTQKSRLSKESLPKRSQELKEFVQRGSSFTTNSGPVANLGIWFGEIERLSTNYLAEAQLLRRQATSPVSRSVIEAHKDLTQTKFNQLLDLGQKLRADAAAIESFLKSNLSTEMSEQARVVARAAEVKLPTPSPVPEQFDLQLPRYALFAGSFGLLILLISLIYRSLAILPLREQLAQQEAILQRQDMLSHFGQVAAELAHEVRNPLTAINARLYTLQKNISTGTPEAKDATVIQKEINRLSEIVKDFLELARPAEPKLVSMTAEPLLKEVQELLAPQFEEQTIQLKYEIESDSVFQGDPLQLKQVLINLVKNAAESIERDGKIILRACRERAELQGRRVKAILLEVEDNGPGVPEDLRERLFDPFFSTKKSGTGLGLAISARIIEKQSGVLNFESKPGQTIFCIALPIKRG